jgi:uncharacterized membrane protein
MNELAQRLLDIPNLHPMVVHFPIVLLPLAVLVDLIAVLRRRVDWARVAAAFYALGALAAWFAAEAGEEAVEGLHDVPARVQPLLSEHSDLGHYTFWLFAALAVLRLAVWWRDRDSAALSLTAARWVIVLIGLGGLGLLLDTAEHGGRLVYRHGLAVETTAATTASISSASESADQPVPAGRQRLQHLFDGSLVWQPVGEGPAVLTGVTEAAPGTDLSAVRSVHPGEESAGIEIELDGPLSLILPAPSQEDVQISTRLDLSEFDGTAGLIVRLNGDHEVEFSLSTSGAAQISKDGSELDQGAISRSEGAVELALSAAGRHLKGMVDGATVAHGHADSSGAGLAGLELSGTGVVRLYELRLTPLDKE